ncbi:hypothetical protein [Streptomyces rimosus]|uniref:hypothetical protein n=1 Tax=Streptomyces rimosus TaxID=1927 RepID=UPI0004C1E84C|nr:hypothetical protein [Streptomyces rimosus]
MTIENPEQFEEWERLKAGSAYTIENLRSVLGDQGSEPQTIIESYLFAKRSLAQSMQALLLAQLPTDCPEFHAVRRRIEEEMHTQYAGLVPEHYLKAPYGSRVHEVLFMLLVRNLGAPVDNALLRTSTQDSIHTERRTRELRELGLRIVSSEQEGVQYYTLSSLDTDLSVIPGLVAKNVRKSTSLPAGEKSRLVALLGA